MDEMEKVEKLREKANVTYEEAKEALEASNGDMLDAMIYLEKQGKVSKEEGTYSTNYEEQTALTSVQETVENDEEEAKKSDRTIAQKIRHLFRLIFIKIRSNNFVVERKGEELINVPLWVLVMIILLSFWLITILLVVGLFLDCRYSVVGPDDCSVVNDVMDKAGDVAKKVKDEFNEK